MPTQCNTKPLEFEGHGRRRVVADFDGGPITSDAGALLLRRVEQHLSLFDQVADCFTDHRNPDRIQHSLRTLIAQRIVAIALGYEDLNDHDHLRHDAVMALFSEQRHRRRDSAPLAGKSTLNRLEHAPSHGPDRYHKIDHDPQALQALLVELFLQAHSQPPDSITLDLDATDDPLHGEQRDRFFHGYYGGYCYLPLYIFCDRHLLCALLRPANIDASAGALQQVQRIVTHLRSQWPDVKILLRADSGFAREPLMAWCEDHQVDYLFGLARNPRLQEAINSGSPLTSCAYVLMEGLRNWGLRYTCLAKATVGSLRLKLLKIGAQVTTSVRRIKVAMASGCPYQREFRLACAHLPP